MLRIHRLWAAEIESNRLALAIDTKEPSGNTLGLKVHPFVRKIKYARRDLVVVLQPGRGSAAVPVLRSAIAYMMALGKIGRRLEREKRYCWSWGSGGRSSRESVARMRYLCWRNACGRDC